MNFISTPIELARLISDQTGKPLKLLPRDLYAFDPAKVNYQYSFVHKGGDFTDLLTALGLDLERLYDAYLKVHGKEKALTEVQGDLADVYISKTSVYVDEHAYYLEFLDQAIAHYHADPNSWEDVKPLAKLVKRFCKELRKDPYHHHFHVDCLLATIQDKSPFYFTRYLRQFFFSLWV